MATNLSKWMKSLHKRSRSARRHVEQVAKSESLETRSLLAAVVGGSAVITLQESVAAATGEFDAYFSALKTRTETLSGPAPGDAAFTETPADPASGTVVLTDPIRPLAETPVTGDGRTRQATTLQIENLSNVLGSWTTSDDATSFVGSTTLGEQIGFTSMQRWTGPFTGSLLFGDFGLRYTGSKLVLTSNIDFLDAAYADIGSPNISVSGNELTIEGDLLIGGGLALLDPSAVPGTDFGDITITATLAEPPIVTDPNISISGATGPGGVFRVGDTVTATWNNTAAGDNNTGLRAVGGVTVDFSQFGGGSAVAATNSGNIWTATYIVVAGSIDATGRNVSVTASNGAGSTTQADTTNATVDNKAPTVVSINRADANPTGANTVDYTVTFSDPVTGVDVGDFALATSGVVGADIVSVVPSGSGSLLANTTANGTTYLTYNRAAWATLASYANYTDISGTPLGFGAPTADADGFRWMYPDRFEGASWNGAAYPTDYLTPVPSPPLTQPAGGIVMPVNTYLVNSFSAKHKITDYNSTTNPNGYIGLAGSIRSTSDYNEPGASVWWEHLAVRLDPVDSIWKIYATSGAGQGSVFELRNVSTETINGKLHLSGDYVFGNTSWLQFFQDINGHLDTELVMGHLDIIPSGVSTYTVTVGTGSLDGTIGLNLADDDSIADLIGNKLGGPGTSNGDSTGQVYSIDKPNNLPVAQPGSVTLNEDEPYTFSAATFPFTDADGDSLASITLSGLNLAPGDALTVDQGSGPVAVSNGMTITASQIASLQYTPALNASGSARSAFDFKVNDVDSGTVAATMTLNVTTVNDVPVAQPGSATTNEDTAITFAVGDFSFTDVESNGLVSISVSNLSLATGDTLTVDQGAGSVAVTNGLTITAAQIPSLTYTPNANANGDARSVFSFKVNDAGIGVVTAAMTLNVTAINDVPVAQSSIVTTNEDTPRSFVAGNFSFTDIESDSLVSITVSNLTLASGDSLTVDQGAGFVAVTNGMTITAAQIASLTYTPEANKNGSARSTFGFLVSDAGSGVLTAVMTLNVTAVNDLPVAQPGSVTTNEDTARTFVVGDFSFTDIESDSLASITISDLTLASGDTLTVDQGSGVVAVFDGMTITAAQIPTLTYTPLANANGSNRSKFDFVVKDTDAGTVAATLSINVTAMDDVSTLSAIESAFLPYGPDSISTTLTSTLTLSEVGKDLSGATIKIIGGYQSGDSLLFTDTGNITGVWNGAGQLTLGGNGTVAQYQAALRSIRYFSSSAVFSARTVSFQVSDGIELSNLVSREVGGTTQLVGSVLSVYGTPNSDAMNVSSAALLSITVNGTTFNYTPASVATIRLYGFAGNDAIIISSLSAGTALTADGGDDNDILNVLSSVSVNTTLRGGSGHDTLTGGRGSDNMQGGSGNDTYVFRNATSPEADLVTELADSGTDSLTFNTVTTAINLKLGTAAIQNVHANRTLKLNSGSTFEEAVGGSADDVLTGNGLGNRLTGNAGHDQLTGGVGSDWLLGGPGNDLYWFGTANTSEVDTIAENMDSGTDTLTFSTLTMAINLNLGTTLIQNVHVNRTLKLNSGKSFENAVGGSADDLLQGNDLPNKLTGNAGQDQLTGADGNDWLLGGKGDDNYVFDPASNMEADALTEVANGGIDTLTFSALTTGISLNLNTTATQALHINRALTLNSRGTFENAVGGSGDDILVGNDLTNMLIGNAGDDQLTGGKGDDWLLGGLGYDTYVFGVITSAEIDTLTETAIGGIDTLSFSTLTTAVKVDLGTSAMQLVHDHRTLKLSSGSTFENATGGSHDDILRGNTLANTLNGNDGNDILLGDNGKDLLLGGNGRDILIGGLDLDELNGGSHDDILIGGNITNAESITKLKGLRSAWILATPYVSRVASLRTGVGSAGTSLMAKINVKNDFDDADRLTGSTGQDWYFRALDDVITDLLTGELVDVL